MLDGDVSTLIFNIENGEYNTNSLQGTSDEESHMVNGIKEST